MKLLRCVAIWWACSSNWLECRQLSLLEVKILSRSEAVQELTDVVESALLSSRRKGLSAINDHKSNAVTKLGPRLAIVVLSAKAAKAEAPDESIDMNCFVEGQRFGDSGLI